MKPAPLTAEMTSAIAVATERGGCLVRNRTTLDLWGPPDFDDERDGMTKLFGHGTILSLIRHGRMRWKDGDRSTAELVQVSG